MLIKESEYLKEVIKELPGSNLKILNFGSQSRAFLREQPHIEENIINTSLGLGHKIVNLDIQEVEGVDLVGDIFDDNFYEELIKAKFDVIFVFNLLEHVTDLDLMIHRIQGLVDKGKYIVFSGPYKYPIHLDPIDNNFRPTLDEVISRFPSCDLIKGDTVKDYTYRKYLFSSPKAFLIKIARVLAFFYKFKKWYKVVIPKYYWLFKEFEITYALLKKK